MLDIQVGDPIIIPKLSIRNGETKHGRYFTIFLATKNPVEFFDGRFFCVKPCLVVKNIFQSLDIYVAIELREISRKLD